MLKHLVEEVNQLSVVAGARLSATGALRHSSGSVKAATDLDVVGGAVLRDGSLEVRLPDGSSAAMVAGSVRPMEREAVS